MEFYQEWVTEEKIHLNQFLKLKGLLKAKNVKIKYEHKKVRVSAEDYFELTKATKVVEAFLAGFSPEDCIKLMDDDYVLYKIDIRSFAGKSYNHIKRLKGRVIGTEGRAKKYIQQVTGAKIIIKGHDVYVLGKYEEAEIARDSIERLLRGSPHSNVYRWMESRKKDLRRRKLLEGF